MGKPLERAAVFLAGIGTSLVAALVVTAVKRYGGFDLFSVTAWVVLPVGAVGTGLVAASGYWGASRVLHRPPSVRSFFALIAIAMTTQLVIYYLDYATALLDDGSPVSGTVGFFSYLARTLEHSWLTVRGHALFRLGAFAYGFTVLQFFGVALGTLILVSALWLEPMCSKCQRLMRKIGRRRLVFRSGDDFRAFHERLGATTPAEESYWAVFREPQPALSRFARLGAGAARLTFSLVACPECRSQRIEETVELRDGSSWVENPGATRKHALPAEPTVTARFEAVRKAA